MDVVLVGLPGSGKSVVGKRLAQRHRAEYVDLDAIVSEFPPDAPAPTVGALNLNRRAAPLAGPRDARAQTVALERLAAVESEERPDEGFDERGLARSVGPRDDDRSVLQRDLEPALDVTAVFEVRAQKSNPGRHDTSRARSAILSARSAIAFSAGSGSASSRRRASRTM